MQPFSACCKAVGHACYGGAVLLSRRQSSPSLCWCLHPGAVSARARARDKAELIRHLQEKNPRAPRPFPPPLPRVSSGPGVSRTPPSVFSTSGEMLNPEPKMVKIGKNSRFWPPHRGAKAVRCQARLREASAPSHTRLPLPRRPLGEMLIVRHESNYRHQSRSPRGDGAEFREGIATGEKAGGDGEQGGRMGRVGRAQRGRERLARRKPMFALSSPEPSSLPPATRGMKFPFHPAERGQKAVHSQQGPWRFPGPGSRTSLP